MKIKDVLLPEYTLCNAPGGSKKRHEDLKPLIDRLLRN